MGYSIDLKNRTFGYLKVVRFSRTRKSKTLWLCKCVCGVEKEVHAYHLKKGLISSCGCKQKELLSNAKRTHGMRNSRIYAIWTNMKTRCSNLGDKNYGGRGIRVCNEWQSSFENFYRDMKEGYQDSLQIDRIDVNGNYCKENCKWVTRLEQAGNKRNNILYRGETARQASLRLGGVESLVSQRIRQGWSNEDAFTIPVSKR